MIFFNKGNDIDQEYYFCLKIFGSVISLFIVSGVLIPARISFTKNTN